jgi:uncharacterized protein YpuA (DUF1002 family)
MKNMKRFVCLVLAFCLALGLSAFAGAIDEGDARAVVGANLTDEQISTVYSAFGISRGDVRELSVTNDEERTYLDGLVDSSVIGTRSISCVYIEILGEGDGLQISTSNISWCTQEMYVNALVTAGIDDAKVIVAAPFSVSGTAALTGIYKAYEDITGETISEEAKLASTEELVVTAELADEIGSYDAVTIVNELKLILDETVNMTDSELREEIESIAKEYNVSLSDSEIDKLIKLCRSLEGLSDSELKEKVESVQNALVKMANAQSTVSNVVTGIKNFFASIGSFFSNLFGKK